MIPEEVIHPLLTGIFITLFREILNQNPLLFRKIQISGLNIDWKNRIKEFPQYYMENIQPKLMGTIFSMLVLLKILEVLVEYTGISMFAYIAFYSLIGFNLAYTSFKMNKISKFLGNILENWHFKGKEYVRLHLVLPLILATLIIEIHILYNSI